MSFKRRQFLTLSGGVLGGLGISAIAQSCSATSSSAESPNPAVSTPISSPLAQAPSRTPGTPASPSKGDVRIAVISDLNSSYGSTDYEPEVDRAIALMHTWQPDLVLCGGDMVAGQKNTLPPAQIRAMWAGFDQHIAAPLRQLQIPYGFTLGNHDASGARAQDGRFVFGTDRAIAAEYWNNPRHNTGLQFTDRAGFPFYYSFQQNDLFFLVWDASTGRVPRDQIAWAERSLASSAAQSAKLRIAIGHLPLYAVAVGRDTPGEYLENADTLRALLERYRVHTYISGHQHAYYPGHVGNLQTLHSGVLGSGKRSLLNGNLRPPKTVTLVDVSLAAVDTVYTTYDMETMTLFNQQSLPRLIAAPNGKVLRRDVEWADLTSAERSLQYVPRS